MMMGSRRVYGGSSGAGGAPATPLAGWRRSRAEVTPSRAVTPALRFFAASSSIPHPEKSGSGEDACYITACGSSVGVADGVGGWAEHGIDAGEYSRELCTEAARVIAEDGELDPAVIMQHAYDQSTNTGSATFCCLTVKNDTLHAANLGDSGFVLMRPSASAGTNMLVLESEEQQHYFNCPKQLGSNSLDVPSDADTYSSPVKEGDIVILGTDGLFDNLGLEEIGDAIDSLGFPLAADEEALSKVANHLAASAYLRSQDKKALTPFCISARESGYDYTGGKMDDITVIVAVVAADCKGAGARKQSPNPASTFYLPPEAFAMEDIDDEEDSCASLAKSTATPAKAGFVLSASTKQVAGSPDTVFTSCTDTSFDDMEDDEDDDF